MITPEQFYAAVSDRLNAVLPNGFTAGPADAGVWLDAPDGLGSFGWGGHFLEDPTDRELYVAAGENILNSLQDCVCVTLREWWPADANSPRHQMSMPGAALDGTTLRLWYGPEAEPTVSLQPIDLA